jgi:TRAP-type C4-dicarboxylate transport system substrate-binding protein
MSAAHPPKPGRLRRLAAAVALGLAALLPAPARAQEPLRMEVIGGLAGVSQYVRFEEPFWRERIGALTQGRVAGAILPLDRAGFPMGEMLQRLQDGRVPFGTLLLAAAAAQEPEFNAVELPALNPDLPSLRRTVELYRPHLRTLLRERYGLELLAVYTYPAQVTWCSRAFGGLRDLAGRRIRTSSVAQAELFQALGATPVSVPFAGMVQALREGRVECAVTGTLSGLAVGLQQVTTHIHEMALAWGVSVFVANRTAWEGLPQEIRAAVARGLGTLEGEIWNNVAQDTAEGLNCSAGRPGCTGTLRGNLTIVPITPADDALRRSLLVRTVLPRWVDRCGPDCADAWNGSLAASAGITAYAQ